MPSVEDDGVLTLGTIITKVLAAPALDGSILGLTFHAGPKVEPIDLATHPEDAANMATAILRLVEICRERAAKQPRN